MDKIIPLKNGLFSDFRVHKVKEEIISKLRELGMTNEKYKLDVEFLTYLVNVIEHLVLKKDKIDKKELCLNIMREIFGASEEDCLIISANIYIQTK
jgi:hypothetical protein